MSNETIGIVLETVKRHLEKHAPTSYLIWFVENAIEKSEGRTPERYELLKLWRKLTAVEG